MTEKTTLKILGMNCKSCAKVIKYGLEEETGLKNADVDFNSAKAYLEFDSVKINLLKIKNKIKELGYDALEI